MWLFESIPRSSPSISGIDPELAAMLEREVRAGAPPIEEHRVDLASPSQQASTMELRPVETFGPREWRFRARVGVTAVDGGVVLAEDEAIDPPLAHR